MRYTPSVCLVTVRRNAAICVSSARYLHANTFSNVVYVWVFVWSTGKSHRCLLQTIILWFSRKQSVISGLFPRIIFRSDCEFAARYYLIAFIRFSVWKFYRTHKEHVDKYRRH